ncbi:MAG: hypothetical protein IJI47_05080, partial [Eubacterium sp.]|nr:hypothetical protein [Eubacterium sp.]
FAFLTVVITVHAYVFYSLDVVNGNTLMEITGADSVLHAINTQGGVYMFGRMLPIWAVVLVEFAFAYTLEILLGSPLSFKMASRMFDPRKNHPMIFETVIISCTVLIMCPTMSFIAAWLYYPYYAGFNLLTLLANWLKLICFNFPFAFFSQVFFIQPFVRFAFGKLFAKDIKARNTDKEQERPQDEQEVIADIFRRMDEIQEGLAHERRQRKRLAEKVNTNNQ